MENVTTLSTVASDFDCAMSQGQVSFPENISLISLSHLHPQISVKLKSFFSPQRANLSDTQRGGRRSLFIYLQMRKEEQRGAKSLNTTILFHGWCCPLPPFCACEVDLMSRSALLRLGRTNLPPGEERETGGGGFNCQVSWCRDRRSFGRIVCLCAEGQPSETPHLIKRKPRLIDKFSNWRPEDGIKSAERPTN